MITGTLTTDLGVLNLPQFEIPVREETLENATDVTTLDFNVYTDFINTKRKWNFGWSILTESEYNAIKAVFESQYTLFQYPRLSIPALGIVNVPVRLTTNSKDVVTNCGEVANFQITMRETAQMPSGS